MAASSYETGSFFLGCAVWAYPGWNGSFYPKQPGDTLERYAERLTTVEGNSFFYALPATATLEAWVERTPEEFRFCPKLPRDVTHSGLLEPFIGLSRKFLDYLRPLAPRLGPIFAQLPPSYGPQHFDDLEVFLRAWPTEAPPLLVEVRHADWYEPQPHAALKALTTHLGVGRVVLDTRAVYGEGPDPQVATRNRKPKVPAVPLATARTCMVRYIGNPDMERNESNLDEWARKVDSWLPAGRDVYFFAHCPEEEHSPFIARELQRRLEDLGAPVPPLPWDGVPGTPLQQDLFDAG